MFGGDPQFVSNLTVWESVETLENFVWNTVHKQFYDRRREWFEVLGDMHFVMWWVPEGHKPTLDEALARLELLKSKGNSPEAFGWDGIEVNGHTAEELHAAVMNRKPGKPFVIVSKTVKGKGVPYMEHVPIWHYRAPSPEEYKQACDELVEISS